MHQVLRSCWLRTFIEHLINRTYIVFSKVSTLGPKHDMESETIAINACCKYVWNQWQSQVSVESVTITSMYELSDSHKYVRHQSRSQVYVKSVTVTSTYGISDSHKYVWHQLQSQVRIKSVTVTSIYEISDSHKYMWNQWQSQVYVRANHVQVNSYSSSSTLTIV